METFQPGAEYGSPYRRMIWVCVNATPRTFEQCDAQEGLAVFQALKRTVPRDTMVMQSGCMMGCKAPGTMVTIAEAGASPMTCLRNVRVEDVSELVNRYVAPRP